MILTKEGREYNANGERTHHLRHTWGADVSGSRWDYDETGNWKRYEQLANGATTLDQPRTHDKGNRLLEIGAGAGSIRVDRAGRMLELPPVEGTWDETFEIVWDAWSRIVEVKQGESTVGKYTYDGLTRRITRETGGELINTYYSDTWRPLEDRVTDAETPGTPTLQAHYLWGARHRDDLVRRDRATTTPGILNETRYALMDYFSPAAICDEEGAVAERYAFSAFGLRSVLAPDYSPRTNSESAFEFAFQGQFEDRETGWLNFAFRYYIPALGRWPSRDPIAEQGGVNVYGMAGNDSLNSLEFLGLEPGLGDTRVDKRYRTVKPIGDLANPFDDILTTILKKFNKRQNHYPSSLDYGFGVKVKVDWSKYECPEGSDEPEWIPQDPKESQDFTPNTKQGAEDRGDQLLQNLEQQIKNGG